MASADHPQGVRRAHVLDGCTLALLEIDARQPREGRHCERQNGHGRLRPEERARINSSQKSKWRVTQPPLPSIHSSCDIAMNRCTTCGAERMHGLCHPGVAKPASTYGILSLVFKASAPRDPRSAFPPHYDLAVSDMDRNWQFEDGERDGDTWWTHIHQQE